MLKYKSKNSIAKEHDNSTSNRTSVSAMKEKSNFQKLRRLYFKARASSFDSTNPETNNDTFRGFFTLFWIAMGFYVILTLVNCYEKEGVVLSLGFFRLMSQDTLALLVADVCMIGQTFLVVPFARLMMKDTITYKPLGVIIQHTAQTVFIFGNLYWVFWRDWPMTQSIFFTLHTFVMFMKMHSYIELNGKLASKYKRYLTLKEEIPIWIRDHGIKDGEKGYSSLDEQSELDDLEAELKYLDEELTHGKVRYPQNLTVGNYIDFLAVPTLVYWMEYPRTTKIRPLYVFEKTMATLGTFLLLYITTERYIYPQLYNPDMSDFRVALEVLFPFLMNYMFIFYIIFECILNWFAEVTRFADRNFYDDWWNSASFEDFARKWNKPVHHWLLRHIYSISMDNYKISKKSASFVTFLFSSCLHEVVMVMFTRRLCMYLFFLQMFQLPLIALGRQPFIRKHPTLGNVIFWIGLFLGPPLLGILYSRQAYWDGHLRNNSLV